MQGSRTARRLATEAFAICQAEKVNPVMRQ
jgi:hypothetical protein